MPDQQHIIVTISRQAASGGAYIGHLLAKKLGYRYVEREVLRQAAEHLGVEISEIYALEERSAGFLEKMIKGFLYGTPEAAYLPPSRRPVYDRELFKAESRIIREIAKRSDAVIVGRAGYAVLREQENVVNVFIHAPLEFRVERLRKFNALTADEAREELEASDRAREKFLRDMTATDRYDARNYHLCIDAEAAGFDRAQEMIQDLVERKKQTLGL